MENIFQHLYETVHPNPFHAGRVFDIPSNPPRFNINHTFLAHWLRSGRGTVVTPNLDPLIEHTWQNIVGYSSDQLTIIRRPTEFGGWDRLINHPDVLWKLHGSSDDPESWAITLSRVGFSLDGARADFVRHLVKEHNVCFIGYRAADLDLFLPILEAHTRRKQDKGKLFWVFYFREGYKTLADYLQGEANIAQLFEVNADCIYPIVTSAERLSTWLQQRCLGVTPVLPPTSSPIPEYDYRQWFTIDLQSIGELATQKLIGYALRVLGKYEESIAVLNDAVSVILRDEEHLTPADEHLVRRTAQLLQESAQTSWQKEDYLNAIGKVKRAQKLLKRIGGGDPGSEFGLNSMILDAKIPLTATERIAAFLGMIKLHWRFIQLSRHPGPGFSPILGQGLCIYHEAKFTEEALKRTPLLRLPAVRRMLIAWYDRAEKLIRKSEFLNSIPGVKRR
ncbi:MAG: SIR2 family protein [Anaerolineales bacterium]|nr:SIR2 family protein [Anaerolineales bacterium]